ncbi:MAG: N-acetylmuramoyl-L-alanine amidase [Paludibacteraceae bacterium]|nr:N-acetylmuramoyl-L-alanine amidase [Paludibacteraceae bacterium]
MFKRSILSTLFLVFISLNVSAFTVVLDAGHGGNDAGAVGSFSKEKNINLRHATLVGDMIKERNPEIKVIYTRDKDIFVELKERANIANRNKADLFVSIHTNSSKNKSASGIETFSLGVSRTKENMEVAMLENSVILLEEDHESKYEGFDPNSTDSYIMFEFMKDQYSQRSIACADYIQTKLIDSSKRVDRGVRQAGFLVLRATAMPSVLVELGFISNREEEKALNNDDKQIENAEAIYQGIIAYIHSLEKKGGEKILSDSNSPAAAAVATATTVAAATTVETVAAQPSKPQTSEIAEKKSENIDNNAVIYKLQILVSSKQRGTDDPVFKGQKNIEELKETVGYKYLIGASNNYNEVLKLKDSVKSNFPGAFIVAYKNGVRVNVQETLKNK